MRKWLIALVLLAAPAQAQTSLLEPMKALRASYPPKLTPAQAGEFLNRLAWEHRAEGWGLLRKTGGTRCPVPQGGEASCDILIHAPSVRHFDVLADAEGVATPVWRDVGPCVLGPSSGCAMANFLAPVAPVGGEPTPPPAPVPEPDPNIPRLFEQVKALTQTVEALRVWADERFAATHEQGQVLASRATTLEHRVDLVERRPDPEYECDGYLNLFVFRIPTGCTIRQR